MGKYELIRHRLGLFLNDGVDLFHVSGHYCTERTCSDMRVGTEGEYMWVDNGKYLTLPASQYTQNALNWVSETLKNNELYPTVEDNTPKDALLFIYNKILIRLSRILGHYITLHPEADDDKEVDEKTGKTKHDYLMKMAEDFLEMVKFAKENKFWNAYKNILIPSVTSEYIKKWQTDL
ncbi:hypothetical protein EIN_038230 [Entamoeba invadens IP1]|uniref:Uncharacterized protein n=1 Tax=Entamoeba invadens IP1 TaxID=370355 RepID=L7FQM4_ENTIV|nr:hypothetical protein EIN_038230 [Entamoeba invadens IP1]ELP94673.1 hypothetical protein EIN_038230 [Entamoeba invadens IP1]|eukprot:XP_004261444.1 hypothetical protein EIN_038230 [Entamoeba invadens IP1]